MRQIGATQAGGIDPAAPREPPAADSERPAGQCAGFVAIDEAEEIGRGLVGAHDLLLAEFMGGVAGQMEDAGGAPAGRLPLPVKPLEVTPASQCAGASYNFV